MAYHGALRRVSWHPIFPVKRGTVKRLDPRLLLDVNPGGIEEKTHRQKWTFEHMVEEAEAPEH